MLPASLISAFLLAALIPGFIYLRLTAPHRPSYVHQTALEELFRLLTAGLVLFVPVAALHLVAVPGLVSSAFATPDTGVAWPDNRLQVAGVLAMSAISGGVLLAAGFAWDYNRRHPIRAAESVWESVFNPGPRGVIVICHLTLKTGEKVSGVIYGVDSLPVGQSRDIALKAPLRITDARGNQLVRNEGRILVTEDQIHSSVIEYAPGVKKMPTDGSLTRRVRLKTAKLIAPSD